MVAITVFDDLGAALRMGPGRGPVPAGAPDPVLVGVEDGPFNFRRFDYTIDAAPLADITVFASVILGQALRDRIEYRDAAGTLLIEIVDGGGPFTSLGQPDDRLYTGPFLGGDDAITGAGFDDRIIGFRGDDRLVGNGGDDTLSGLQGRDTVTGGDGDDLLDGGTGRDTMTGGDGADVFVLQTDFALDTITDFEPGLDRIDIDVRFGRLTLETVRPGHVTVIHRDDVLDIFDTAGTLVASDLGRADFL